MTEWLVPKRHRFFCEKHPLNIKCKMQNAKCKVQTPRLHTKDCPTVASLVYGVPLNERSRVLGVRVGGGGEPASRRESFKTKVTFLTISPPPGNAGAPSLPGFPKANKMSFGGSRQREPRFIPTAIPTATHHIRKF